MEYSVIRSDRRSIAAEIKQNKVIIRAPKCYSDEQIEAFVTRNGKWIRTHLEKAREDMKKAESFSRLTAKDIEEIKNRAKSVIPLRVAHYAPLVGVSYGRVSIRAHRSQWGSCTGRGNLSFNCLLMLAPPEVLDSVVVHELCHRKVMNHSDKFYAEVLRVFPDYKKAWTWLKNNGDALLWAGEDARDREASRKDGEL